MKDPETWSDKDKDKGGEESIYQTLWSMPRKPLSENQNLSANEENLRFIGKEPDEILNVQISMMLAMASVLGSQSNMKLNINSQVRLAGIFVEYFNV